MKKFVLLMGLFAALAVWAQELEIKAVEERNVPKPVDMTMLESPLEVNGSRTPLIDLGRTFKLNQRIFGFVIKNPSDTPVEYTGIVINCNCTRIIGKVPSKGVIPAHGELPLLVRLNGPDLNVKDEFFRIIRLDLKDYRAFQVNFKGTLDKSLMAVYDDDPDQLARTRIMVGYLEKVNEKWNTKIHIYSELPPEEPLELANVQDSTNFAAKLEKVDDHHWILHLESKNPMKPGVLKEGIVLDVVKPAPNKHQMDKIYLPFEGVAGYRVFSSTDELFYDPQKETEPVITQAILLTRLNFMDSLLLRSIVLKQQSPYKLHIPPLKMEEVSVDPVEGVTFKMEPYKDGVLVHCTMERDKLTEEGVWVSFRTQFDEPADVRFAILGEEERAEREAEEAKRRAEEEERLAAEKEQEELQKNKGKEDEKDEEETED